MFKKFIHKLLCGLLLMAGPALVSAASTPRKTAAARVDYNRDIRPILSENCYACHGPDSNKRKAGLRLDRKEEAYAKLGSGDTAIVPGKSSASQLIHRLTTTDDDDKMPPGKTGKTLTREQVETLKKWIDQGAEWTGHWAYLAPKKVVPPRVKNKAWVRNAIDHFILARLEKEGLQPSREADKLRLIRRVTLDLTGLPPTPAEVDAFLADISDRAYEKLVDRLLESPHYGERMAQFWLDVARFADTNGYHIDNHRDIWLWREWVLNAFNKNMPFDKFTVEQLAGDLLPDATIEQKIASGFNRNEMVNFEGGADPNEYSVKYVVGRVDTTSRVFLGSTMACAECHDHKYDPLSQKEYYQFFAFFNTVDEKGLDGQKESPVPRLSVPTPEQTNRVAEFVKKIAELEEKEKELLEKPHEDRDKAQLAWQTGVRTNALEQWHPLKVKTATAAHGGELKVQEDGSVLVLGDRPETNRYEITLQTEANNLTGLQIEAIADDTLPERKSGRGEKGEFLLSALSARAKAVQIPADKTTNDIPPMGTWYSVGPFKAASIQEAFSKVFGPERDFDLTEKYDEGKLKWTPQPGFKDGATNELKGENSATYLYRQIFAKAPQELVVSLGSDDGIQVWLNGRKILANDAARGVAADQEKLRLRLNEGENKLLMKINNGGGGFAFYFKPLPELMNEYPIELGSAIADTTAKEIKVATLTDDKGDTGWNVTPKKGDSNQVLFVTAQQPFGFPGGSEITLKLDFLSTNKFASLGRFRIKATSSEKLTEFIALPEGVRAAFFNGTNLTDAQKLDLQKYYRQTFVKEAQEQTQKVAAEKEAKTKFEAGIPTTMVMREMEKPRETFLLVRGDFQKKGDKVTPGVPAILPPLPEGPTNRLALAKWLTSPNHPLTSRVTVNRYWQQYFGQGLVRTADDFGSQGEWPTHPELLDYLAVRFMETGWDVKAMQKLIVMSATYRQSSNVDPKILQRDPENRLLSRAPRLRLDAESVRDQVLAVSGLLNRAFGGPSVAPYQPPGLWEAIGFIDNGNFSSQAYKQSKGEDNYRRGLYTYWKRSMPYASFVAFDAPNRETCTVKRQRTNTPLQALVLLNDPVYVEGARVLAQRILRDGGPELDQRLRYAFKLCLSRPGTARELEILKRVYLEQREAFEKNPEDAAKLIKVGESKPAPEFKAEELAAWTAVANMLFNLDEMITRS